MEHEIDRFQVVDDRGRKHVVVHYRQIGVSGLDRYAIESGQGVNVDEDDPDVFYLPIGISSPWVKCRKV